MTDTWFVTWITALESEHSTVDALGVDGCVTVSYGDRPLVSARMDRAEAHL